MSRAWLTLADTPGVDGHVAAQLLATFGNAEAAVAARPEALVAAGVSAETARRLTRPDAAHIEAGTAWLEASPAHHLVGWDDARYPRLLRQLRNPPAALFVRGDPRSLALPQLAIVGSRNASKAGIETAQAFAAHLAGCGLAITSGLALGIDAAAHRGALAAGGRTLAVMGTGPEQVYPAANAALAAEIAGAGAVCTEFMPGVPVQRENFPRRNRIISALAVGTLVVEARLQSGALITAHCAAEQGREVFAIPGSIHNPLAKGCHRLIREGAKLVESADHILEELAELLAVPAGDDAADAPSSPATAHETTLDPDYAHLLDALGWDTVDVDTLVLRSGLTPAEVSSMLLILELKGSVQPLPGGRFQRQR
jgi:DNA processing protein